MSCLVDSRALRAVIASAARVCAANTQWRLRAVFALIVVVIASASVDVAAQASRVRGAGWLEDRSRAEGPGFRLGRLELHPGFAAEIGYDSNVFLSGINQSDAGIMRMTAHLLASTLGAQRRDDEGGEGSQSSNRAISFRGGLSASMYHYFATQANTNVETDASLNLVINPDGNFQARLYDEFSRSIRPFSNGPVADTPTFAIDRNVAGLELSLGSKSKTLTGRMGYEFGFAFFEDDEFDYSNSVSHRAHLGVTWNFFPSTALFSETSFVYRDFINAGDAPAVILADNMRLSSVVGINGAVLDTFFVSLLVGYTAGFLPNNFGVLDEFESVEAGLELKWAPLSAFSVALGYRRQFLPSYTGIFRRSDRIYLRGQVVGWGAFMLGLDSSISFEETGTAVDPSLALVGFQDKRSDIRLNVKLFAEYRITDWVAITGSAGVLSDFTDFEYVSTDPSTPIVDPRGEYTAFEAFLGARIFY